MKELTDKQQDLYDLILDGVASDYQFTYREFAEMLEVSKDAVKQRMDALRKKGYVDIMGSRAIKILK